MASRSPLAAQLERLMRPLDWLFNRVYTSRWNPLYQSGALALFLVLLTLVSGIYLIFCYSISAPYESVSSIHQAYPGVWIRSLHRYASDLAVVAIVFHILKMLTTDRTWGPRMRAWMSGWVVFGAMLVCGWTGLALIWDEQAQLLVLEVVRLLDCLPFFPEPLARLLVGPEMPRGFFFSLLFLHVAAPLGLGGLYLLHVSSVARPTHQPPRPIRLYTFALLAVLAALVPAPLGPAADLSKLPGRVPVDFFYSGWLIVSPWLTGWAMWAALLLTALLALSVPWWWRPTGEPPQASWVDWESCTGCTTCYLDCPYEAISMVERTGPTADERHSKYVALVNADACVSCGICSGSCAPMGVGPPDRTGKAQLLHVKGWFDEHRPIGKLVVVACTKSPTPSQGVLFPVSCAGAVHTSVLEYLLKRGALGVYLLSCPQRDCWNREGPRWAHERIYNQREAELQARVDRRRIATGAFAFTEARPARAAIDAFAASLAPFERPLATEEVAMPTPECEEKQIDG
ncbi:MAG: hydrogenase iron-sulfur subunit [Vulcanimicrobiota bacterium]